MSRTETGSANHVNSRKTLVIGIANQKKNTRNRTIKTHNHRSNNDNNRKSSDNNTSNETGNDYATIMVPRLVQKYQWQ